MAEQEEYGNGRVKLSMGFVAWAVSLIAIVVANWASTTAKISALDDSMKAFSQRMDAKVDWLSQQLAQHEMLPGHPVDEERLQTLSHRMDMIEQRGK